jgi:tetratricopeptide (TPR) repeat protein
MEAISDTPRPLPDGLAASAHHQQGLAALRDGKLAAAVQHFRDALQLQPDAPATLHHLGIAFARQRKLDEAIPCFRRALALKPDAADSHLHLGIAWKEAGRFDEAISACHEALRLKPNDALVHFHLADALRHAGRLADAVAAYQQCLRLKPEFVDGHHNLGLALSRQGKPKDAEACYRQALRLQPDHASAHNNLGVLLEARGQRQEAIAAFHESIRLKPDVAEAHNNLGVALAALGKLTEAVTAYRQALRLKPDYADAHNNIGNALRDNGQLDEALGHFQEALRLRPEYAEAHNNLGILRVHQGDLAEGVACYDRALQLKPDYPDARKNRSLAWLAGGDFERGWPEYEYRWQGKDLKPRTFRQPRWDGKPLAGRTILLHAEQGWGDTLQFVRYALLVKQRDGRVVLECQKPLVPLLKGCLGVDEVIAEGSPLPDFDVQAPLLSLPGIFRTTLATIPSLNPYLFPEPELRRHWHQALAHIRGFKVGIVWQGNRGHRGDRHRSIPLAHFAPLARLAGVQLVSLQKGHGSDQLEGLKEPFPIQDLGRLVDARGVFTDAAAFLKELDLVVACDTALAHLAGALGTPVWVLLPMASDWRWLREREDTPWYPTMRLFRQKERGKWDEVLGRIAQALGQRLEAQ